MKVLLTAALTASLSLSGVGTAPQAAPPAPAPAPASLAKAGNAAPAGAFHYCLAWWFTNKRLYRKYCL